MKICTTFRLATLSLLTCLTSTPTAYAASTTTTFDVTASVAASCTVSAGGALTFGAYTGAQIDQTTTVSITCTNTTPYTVGLNDGINSLVTQRRMTDGTNFLNYELYSDSGRTTRWGNASGSWVSDNGSGSAQSKTVYGRLAGSQALFIGSYTDTITVTVTY